MKLNISDKVIWEENKINNSVCDNLDELDKKKQVILSTVHKSKGFEFGRVFIIDISNFPSPRATKDQDLEQEENAKYIAFSRAEEELYIVNDKE